MLINVDTMYINAAIHGGNGHVINDSRVNSGDILLSVFVRCRASCNARR